MKQFIFYEFMLKLKTPKPVSVSELFILFSKKNKTINLSKRHFINYLDFFEQTGRIKSCFASRKGTNKQLIKHYKKTTKI